MGAEARNKPARHVSRNCWGHSVPSIDFVRGARSRTAPDFYPGFLDHYMQTVTRKKVAGMEVASLRELVF